MPAQDHFYGGQAVIEGVMMRGRGHWAVAVRRPDQSVHIESHEVRSIARRFPLLAKPGLRGILALGEDDKRLTPRQMAFSMALAFVMFTALFVVGPYLGLRVFRRQVHSGLVRNLAEGGLRILLFLGYLALIGRIKDIRRVFQYHGAEHKTISAYEHGDPLEPVSVDRWSTLHVRCGTNFLLIVMLLTVLVYTAFGSRGILAGILFRVVAIPVIAGISYEMLRLGARFTRSRAMRALMAPGLWLQKITTKPPDLSQIQVAIAAFEEVLRREGKLTTAPAD